MNQKFKEFRENHAKIIKLKNKHVTKKHHQDILIIALIFAMTGFLIGLITNQLNNLSYVINTLFITYLGSNILYRYSQENRYKHTYNLEYNSLNAILPRLVRDFSYITCAILTILLTQLNGNISNITTIFYTLLFIILIYINIKISHTKYIDYTSVYFGHMITFSLYTLYIFTIIMKLLPIENGGILLFITGLIVFFTLYTRNIITQKHNQTKFINIMYVTLYMLFFVYGSYLLINSEQYTEENFLTVYTQNYEYETLYEDSIHTAATSNERIIIITKNKQLIIFDYEYNILKEFDISDINTNTYHLYEHANTFYLAATTNHSNSYDTYYIVDENEGLKLITDELFNLGSFYYNDHLIYISDYKHYIVSQYGKPLSLSVFLEDNQNFMIEDNEVLFYSPLFEGRGTYHSNNTSTTFDTYYDDGFVLDIDYNSEKSKYDTTLCSFDEFKEYGYINSLKMNCTTLEQNNLTTSSTVRFIHLKDKIYLINELGTTEKVFKINVFDETGNLENTYEIKDNNITFHKEHVIKYTSESVEIARIDSPIISYRNFTVGPYQTSTIIILISLLIIGLPKPILGDNNPLIKDKEDTHVK